MMTRHLVKAERVSFEPEPLAGLQVLGMLETRLLGFSRLFILDATEDSFQAHRHRTRCCPSHSARPWACPVAASGTTSPRTTFFACSWARERCQSSIRPGFGPERWRAKANAAATSSSFCGNWSNNGGKGEAAPPGRWRCAVAQRELSRAPNPVRSRDIPLTAPLRAGSRRGCTQGHHPFWLGTLAHLPEKKPSLRRLSACGAWRRWPKTATAPALANWCTACSRNFLRPMWAAP